MTGHPRLLLALALALASPAVAQQSARPADVVVTGVRDQKREVREFVGALAEASTDRQLSRFETRAACPAALGLSPDQRAAVVARLRAVAKAAGVPLAKAKCRPNVLVVVARDKKALLQRLAGEKKPYFASMTKDDVRRLIDDASPAAAWQLAGPLLNGDGVELQAAGDGMLLNRTSRPASRITEAARPHFAAAAVVIQADALTGLTTTQLADYAAMRVFARTDPARLADSAAPTILKVLDAPMDSEVPVTLTRWDLGLLRGLYASSVNLVAAAQRAEIARRVGDQVAADGRED